MEVKKNIIDTIDFLSQKLLGEQHKFVANKRLIQSLLKEQDESKSNIKGLKERIDYELTKLHKVKND